MACQRQQVLAAFQVPHLQRGIAGGRDRPPSVRRQRHGIHLAAVAFERPQHLPAFQIPHLQGLIVGGRNRLPPVRRHRHAIDFLGVARERVPQAHARRQPGLFFALRGTPLFLRAIRNKIPRFGRGRCSGWRGNRRSANGEREQACRHECRDSRPRWLRHFSMTTTGDKASPVAHGSAVVLPERKMGTATNSLPVMTQETKH